MDEISSHSAPWRGLWPWLLCSLLLHALWLAPGSREAMPAQGAPMTLTVRRIAVPVPRTTALDLPKRATAVRKASARAQSAPVEVVPDALDQARAPASGHWRYRLDMNGEQGWAELDWAQDGANYQLQLRRELAGRALPEWHSAGRLDAAGLQPLRFELRRQGRAREAINFDPEAGLLRLSTRAGAQSLHAGAQDRLSWLFALAAHVNGRTRDREVNLVLVSGRGEQLRWRFRRVDDEEVSHWVGRCEDAPLLRIEIWLDPRREHLPLRVRQSFDEGVRSDWTLEEDQDVASP